MGRRIRKSDLQGDLEQLLEHCLGLADKSGHSMTAIHISTALDQFRREVARGSLGGVTAQSAQTGQPLQA